MFMKATKAIALLLVLAVFGRANAADEKAVDKGDKPKIQMAILLDTSGSMKGLLNQARTQLWSIVNEFTTAKRNGKQPVLEVALYEYGHASLGAKNGFMRQIVPMTDNLDKVSEELFKLVTGGSAEFCGQAIDKAASKLKWSESHKDLKCIFIAGNEEFTQGPVDYRAACKTAANKGITVSTIYCGAKQEGVANMWLEASKLADGSFSNIDQNRKVPNVVAPQDNELAKLNVRLNTTYVAYGSDKKRMESVQRQVAQDGNAAKSNPIANNSRIQFKASHLYNNAGWDLCDAITHKRVKLEDLKEDQLPEALRKMSVEERKKYIADKIAQRKAIQAEITKLSKLRATYVANEMKRLSVNLDDTLDAAVVGAAREQAVVKEFSFEK